VAWMGANLLVKRVFFLLNGKPGFDSTCSYCVTCYDVTELLEIFYIFQLVLVYHNPYCGWLPSDSHYLTTSRNIVLNANCWESTFLLCR